MMGRIRVNDRYSVWYDAPRVRVIDDFNGAVVVDFRVPRDAEDGFGAALKKAVDEITGKPAETKTKKKKSKTVEKTEVVEDVELDAGTEGEE